MIEQLRTELLLLEKQLIHSPFKTVKITVRLPGGKMVVLSTSQDHMNSN